MEGFKFEPETYKLMVRFAEDLRNASGEPERVADFLEGLDQTKLGLVVIDLLTAFTYTAQQLALVRKEASR